jgi:hypothetical protein
VPEHVDLLVRMYYNNLTYPEALKAIFELSAEFVGDDFLFPNTLSFFLGQVGEQAGLRLEQEMKRMELRRKQKKSMK